MATSPFAQLLIPSTFRFAEFKERIANIVRITPLDTMPYTAALSGEVTPHAFITFHYYNFINDKLAIVEYPRSVAELLCFFIAKCEDFTFRLEPTPLCYNIIDIAENLKDSVEVSSAEYSGAIGALLCDLMQNNWGDFNALLEAWLTALEKNPYHLAVNTEWIRHDPPEESSIKTPDQLEAEADIAAWEKKKANTRANSYMQEGGHWFIDDRAYADPIMDGSMKLRRIMCEKGRHKNEKSRQREIELLKSKYLPSEFEKIVARYHEFGSNAPRVKM